jgi:hypothetical protein
MDDHASVVRTARIIMDGFQFVHPPEHPRAGQVIEFPVHVPGSYSLRFAVEEYFMLFQADIDEDGRATLRLLDYRVPPRILHVDPHAEAHAAMDRMWRRLLEDPE